MERKHAVPLIQWIIKRWVYLALVAIFLLAAVYRLSLSIKPRIYTYDSYYYLCLSRSLVTGFSYSIRGIAHAKFLPLYPVTISMVSIFTRNPEVAGKLVNALSFSLAVFPIYGIGKNMFNRTAGLLAALFYALEPLTITWATIPMTEGLMVLLICLSFYLFTLWFEGGKDRYLYWAALVGGLLALTRWEGWFILIIMYMVLLYRIWKRGESWRKLLLVTVFFVIPYIPWMVRNLFTYGNPIQTQYAGEISTRSGEMQPSLLWMRLQKYLLFSDYPPLEYTNQYYNYALLVSGYAGLAIMLIMRRYRRFSLIIIPWFILFGPLHFLFFYFSSRYLIGAIPTMCLGAGLTFSCMLDLFASLKVEKAIKVGLYVVTLFLVLMVCVNSLPVTHDLYTKYILMLEDDVGGLATKQAFLWFKENGPAEAVVASDTGAMGCYYLDRPVLFVGTWSNFDTADIDPQDPWPDLEERGVDYLFLYAYSPSLEEAFEIAEMSSQDLAYFELVHSEFALPTVEFNSEMYAFILLVKRDKYREDHPEAFSWRGRGDLFGGARSPCGAGMRTYDTGP